MIPQNVILYFIRFIKNKLIICLKVSSINLSINYINHRLFLFNRVKNLPIVSLLFSNNLNRF